MCSSLFHNYLSLSVCWSFHLLSLLHVYLSFMIAFFPFLHYCLWIIIMPFFFSLSEFSSGAVDQSDSVLGPWWLGQGRLLQLLAQSLWPGGGATKVSISNTLAFEMPLLPGVSNKFIFSCIFFSLFLSFSLSSLCLWVSCLGNMFNLSSSTAG